MAKRLFDIIFSILGLVALSPLLVGIAVAIRLDSPGRAIFRQERVGRGGLLFRIHKFRTMVANAEDLGGQMTTAADPRVTRVGLFLRRHKLDELPQLLDVLQGTMSLVGPRPQVPSTVALYPPDVREAVLSVRPGITDRASIVFRDEQKLLAKAKNPEQVYVQRIMPRKLRLSVDYAKNRTLWGDVGIIVMTLRALFR